MAKRNLFAVSCCLGSFLTIRAEDDRPCFGHLCRDRSNSASGKASRVVNTNVLFFHVQILCLYITRFNDLRHALVARSHIKTSDRAVFLVPRGSQPLQTVSPNFLHLYLVASALYFLTLQVEPVAFVFTSSVERGFLLNEHNHLSQV